MAITKGLHPQEARRCAAESESICWALIWILLALVGVGGFLFMSSLGA
jgi:hypothetical protein